MSIAARKTHLFLLVALFVGGLLLPSSASAARTLFGKQPVRARSLFGFGLKAAKLGFKIGVPLAATAVLATGAWVKRTDRTGKQITVEAVQDRSELPAHVRARTDPNAPVYRTLFGRLFQGEKPGNNTEHVLGRELD